MRTYDDLKVIDLRAGATKDSLNVSEDWEWRDEGKASPVRIGGGET